MGAAAEIMHQLPGRLRLRFADGRGNAHYLEHLSESLGRCPGVQSIEVNPRTGSVLLRHDAQTSDIIEYGQVHSLFTIRRTSGIRQVPSQRVLEAVESLNTRLQQETEGAWDLRELGFVMLSAAGIVQALRRNVWPASVSLLWYAVALLERQRAARAGNSAGTRS